MTGPREILPHAVYEPSEAAALLRVGLDKLEDYADSGRLVPMTHTARRRYWGEALIRFCRGAAGLDCSGGE